MKLKNITKLTEADLHYLAGFLDGDGSIMAQIVKGNSYKYGYSIRVTICFYQKTKRHWFLLKLRKLLGKDWKYFATLPKFPRITYREAIVELRKSGFKTKFGDDLGTKEEKFLVDKRKLPLFITHYPTKLKAFYMKRDPEDHEQVLASDLMIPGIEN